MCGSLVPRELTLTSKMYPLLFSESFRINNANISNLSIRNVYQHTSDLRNLKISHPSLFSLSIRNLYKSFRQFPERLKVNIPTVTYLWISNLYNKHRPPEESFRVNFPVLTNMYIRNQLQQLFTYPLDETIKMGLPTPLDLHHKNVVSKYLEQEIGVFKINTPSEISLEQKNILNKTSQTGPQLEVAIPTDIHFSGTVKPYITNPILSGSFDDFFENQTYKTVINLDWEDESITHAGYSLYKDTNPIPENTNLTPIFTGGREVFDYVDSDIEEDTTYYYRVTPVSYLGKFFSNLISVVVPIYLRAPHSFTASYQSLSYTVNSVGKVMTLTEVNGTAGKFLDLNKVLPTDGKYLYEIHLSNTQKYFTSLTPFYGLEGKSVLEKVLRKERANYTTVMEPERLDYIYKDEISVGGISHTLNKVKSVTSLTEAFRGITKSFIKGSFVILGSVTENRKSNYLSTSPLKSLQGFGYREMVLWKPNAFIKVGGDVKALAAYYINKISNRNIRKVLNLTPELSNLDAVRYVNEPETRKITRYLSKLDPVLGTGSYTTKPYIETGEPVFLNYGIEGVDAKIKTYSSVIGYKVFCTVGSNIEQIECSKVNVPNPFNTLTSVSTLDMPRSIKTSVEEDQDTVLFSGYLPPVGYPLDFESYVVDGYVIPIFKRQTIPGDKTRFTIYEKLYKSKEITSGYTPPEGTAIKFSLFVDED